MKVPGFSFRLTGIQLLSMAWMSLCLAGPPTFPGLQKMAAAAKAESAKVALLPAIRRQWGGGRTLDLRPPELPQAGDDLPGNTNRHLLGSENKNASSLAEISMTKPMSPAEAFARRVHKEGLPVARLWETRSALVSVGLNQKGKPGLWLIQKIH